MGACILLAILAIAAISPLTSRAAGPHGSLAWTDDGPSEADTRIPGHYIVVLEDSVAHPKAVAKAQANRHDGELGFTYGAAINGYSAELSKSAVAALRRDPRVKYVTPDHKMELFSQSIPAGIKRIHATENSIADIDGSDDSRVNVDIAIIDTGIDYSHPDLNVYRRTNCVPAGEGTKDNSEFSQQTCVDESGTDSVGHGSHVAGIAGAIDNGIGSVGAAPGARLWAVKVFGKGGSASESWVIAGVNWVKSHATEIEVANMSLGCVCPFSALEAAIDATVDAGVVFSVAAGNSEVDVQEVSPARNPNVITVSALADYDGEASQPVIARKPNNCPEDDETGENSFGSDDTLAWFSNFGTGVDIAAPGVCIYSTLPGNSYNYLSGTSMAAPYVAGAAALLASESNPNSKKDVEAIRQQLVDRGSQDWTDIWTYGGEKGKSFDLEGVQDETQEPLLDIGPQSAAAYTTRASERRLSSVVLNGGVNPYGVSSNYQFEYGSTTSYGTKVPASPQGVGSGSKDLKVSESISGLNSDGTYHYRLVSTSSKGTTYGEDRVFRTQATAFTGAEVEKLEASSVTLAGWVNPAGISSSYQFEYGTTTSYGDKAPKTAESVGSGTSEVTVSQHLTGLQPNTTYHFRVVRLDSEGHTYYGTDRTFTTPVAVKTTNSSAYVRKAVLRGSINPIGKATAFQFELGRTTAYDRMIPTEPKDLGSGEKIIQVTQMAEDLEPETTYHYRIAAISSQGMTYGADTSFTTGTAGFTAGSVPLPLKADASTLAVQGFDLVTGWHYPGAWPNGAIRCGVPALTAEMQLETETLSFDAGDSSCDLPSGYAGLQAPLTTGSCELEFQPGTQRVDGIFDGTMGIGGNECTGISVKMFTPGSTKCELLIPPQQGLPAEFWNEKDVFDDERPAIHVRVNGWGLLYSNLKGPWCWNGTFTDGQLFTELMIKSDTEDPVEIQVTDEIEAAVTGAAEGINPHAATLTGEVRSRGKAAIYAFEYGTTTQYGHEAPVPVGQIESGEPSTVPVSEVVDGLEANTTYHYRLVALTHTAGEYFGSDGTFTTPPPHKPILEASGYPAQVEAEQESSDKHVLALAGGSITCEGAEFNASLSGATREIALSPKFSGCTVFGFAGGEVKANGCKYVLHVANAGPPYAGSFDISCPPEKAVEAVAKLLGVTRCTITIPSQSGLAGISYANAGAGNDRAVSADASVSGLSYHQQAGTGVGKCATGDFSNGALSGTIGMAGLEEGGSVGLYLSGESSLGLYLAGKESAELAAQPILEASGYPAQVEAEQESSDKHVLALAGGSITCEGAEFNASLSGATREIALSPKFSGCTVFGFAGGEVKANGCKYVLHVANAGPPYAGSFDISCPPEKAVEAVAKLLGVTRCTITIPSQSGLAGISYANAGAGNDRAVSADASVSGLSYHQQAGTGVGKCATGDFSNGALSGTIGMVAWP